jgi:hypothetical protein
MYRWPVPSPPSAYSQPSAHALTADGQRMPSRFFVLPCCESRLL